MAGTTAGTVDTVPFEVGLAEQAGRAAERVGDTTKQRRDHIEVLEAPGGLALADAPERVAARIDRLSRYAPDVKPVSPSRLIAGEPAAMEAAGKVLERIIGTRDLIPVRYLEAGTLATRAVARVNIRDDRGRVVGYGTGSLVSPDLLLTNHHVLPDADVARCSAIELNHQDGLDGRPLAPVLFGLDPQRLFLADDDLDYALVAIKATTAELAPFGFNRIIEAEGKAIVGDFVTIVQHPGGERKQVALRENRIVGLLESFMHYEADTEPGSSGSPVFNDQWEIVALHHASVPVPDRSELGGYVNEGIRVSRLVADVRRQATALPPAAQALVDAFLGTTSDMTTAGSVAPVLPAGTTGGPPPAITPVTPVTPTTTTTATATATLMPTLPASAPDPAAVSPTTGPSPAMPVRVTQVMSSGTAREGIRIDPDYTNRRGYDPDFLGRGGLRVALPALPDDLVAVAGINAQATSDPRYVLPYHHFSVVMHRARRLALLTAVNIDGNTSVRLRREPDRWALDPRLPAEEQTGEDVYRNNALDRGHLVRRLDPAWGPSRAVAKAANDDTFHFTNCTPQHEDFNQNQTTWAGLEDYVLENADNRDLRVSVLTGPVLGDDDPLYRGVLLPQQFWKVVAMVKLTGELSATGYLLSQEALIEGLEVDRDAFSYGAYRTYQVPIRRIEALTRLSFGPLVEADPLARLEATPAAVEITDPEQLVL